ncbi:hypothetical protein KIPB_001755 [Kipferlia bialata]|uniref:DUF4470 domain-containing protein n=1 Tax=Kipferlia bialata TaxID=797122 RepID=A0A9K3CQF4_9EUKA|nr:hypothetical protein KIPB_001755 [Kipferlia bialata]|eukprot:g1755.t1
MTAPKIRYGCAFRFSLSLSAGMLQPLNSFVHIPDTVQCHYPFGNTPSHPMPLVPVGEGGAPSYLLLGCGDARHMYDTLLHRSGNHHFTLNDMQPEVLCRALILAHSVTWWGRQDGAPPKRRKPYASVAAYLWRVHYNAYLSPKDHERLRETCRRLAADVTEMLSVPTSCPDAYLSLTQPMPLPSLPGYLLDRGTCMSILPVLTLWGEREGVPFLETCARSRLDLHIRQFRASDRGIVERAKDGPPRASTYSLKTLCQVARKAAEKSVCERQAGLWEDKALFSKHLDYIVHGSYEGEADTDSVANPTVYRACDFRLCDKDTPPQWTAHYGTQPVLGYPQRVGEDNFRSDVECETIFTSWMRSLDKALSAERVTVTLLAGDCLQLLLERSLGPTMFNYIGDQGEDSPSISSRPSRASRASRASREFRFDYISASNIGDFVGLLNILIVAPGFLRTPGVSVLSTVFLHRDSGQSVQEFIRESTGVRTRDLPHLFGVRVCGDDEEMDRGSDMLAFSLLPSAALSISPMPRGHVGASAVTGYTSLSFCRCPIPSPPPCIDMGQGSPEWAGQTATVTHSPDNESHLHKLLLGVLSKTHPTGKGVVGDAVPSMSAFCALVAVGCRRGLFSAQAPGGITTPYLVAVPEALSHDSMTEGLGDREAVGSGEVVRSAVSTMHLPPGPVKLYQKQIASPIPLLIQTLCGAGPQGPSHPLPKSLSALMCNSVPYLLATLSEYGIDTRTCGPRYTLNVKVTGLSTNATDQDLPGLEVGSIVDSVVLVPRRLVCTNIDITSSDYTVRLNPPSVLPPVAKYLSESPDMMHGVKHIFEHLTPAVQARMCGTNVYGESYMLGPVRPRDSTCQAAQRTAYTIHGVGPVAVNPVQNALLKKTIRSPFSVPFLDGHISGPNVPHSGKHVSIEACSVWCAIPDSCRPKGWVKESQSGSSRVNPLTWLRKGGRGGSRPETLAFEIGIPPSIPNNIVSDPKIRPSVEASPLGTDLDAFTPLPGVFDGYTRHGVRSHDQSLVGEPLSDAYSVCVRLGGKVVGTVTLPVPVDMASHKLQISRKRRFVRVRLSSAPYTLPAPSAGAFVSVSPNHTMESIEPGDKDAVLLWGAITLRANPVRVGMLTQSKARLSQCLGMANNTSAMRTLGELTETMQALFVGHVRDNIRLFQLQVIRGNMGAMFGAVCVHGLYRTASSCVLDVSVVFNAAMPRDVQRGTSKAFSHLMGPAGRNMQVRCTPEEVVLLGRVLTYMERYTLDAEVHPDIRRVVPKAGLKYVVRLGIQPTHCSMVMTDAKSDRRGEKESFLASMAHSPMDWMEKGAVNY